MSNKAQYYHAMLIVELDSFHFHLVSLLECLKSMKFNAQSSVKLAPLHKICV